MRTTVYTVVNNYWRKINDRFQEDGWEEKGEESM
jgi:hypothetical protein